MRYTIESLTEEVFDKKIDFPIRVSQETMDNLLRTHIGIGDMDLSSVLVFSHDDQCECCAFMGPVQPELLNKDNYYLSLGSGKPLADPFLRFIVDTFCPNGPPTVREAIFLATWVVQHVIDTSPGGVAGPIKIAAMSAMENEWEAYELPENEIDEHREAVGSASNALRDWRDELMSDISDSAEDLPRPPT